MTKSNIIKNLSNNLSLIDCKSNFILYSSNNITSSSFGIIEFPTKKVILEKNLLFSEILSIALSPSGKYYAIGNVQKFKKNKNKYKEEYTFIFGKINKSIEITFETKEPIYAIFFSPDENYIIIRFYSHLDIYSIINNNISNKLIPKIDFFDLYKSINNDYSVRNYNLIAVSLDSSLLAFNCYNQLQLWNIKNNQLITTFRTGSGWDEIKMICFSPNNKFIAVYTGNTSIIIWNLENYTIFNFNIDDSNQLLSIIFSLDSTEILTASSIGFKLVVESWNLESGQKIKTINETQEVDFSYCLSFDQNRKYIFYTVNNSIKCLNIEILGQMGGKKSDLIKISKKHNISLKTKLQLFNSLKRKI
jgi:uncharacterized protein with WD repeat